MDMAKAVALLITHGGRPEDYYGENKVPGPLVPIVAIPTTAGTGSEVTPCCCAGRYGAQHEGGDLQSVSHSDRCDLRSGAHGRRVLRSITAVSGADALTHAVESFTAAARTVTPRLSIDNVFVGKNVLSDQFALLAITSIWKSLPSRVHGRQGYRGA